jgi:hypothetical protein
MKDGSKVYTDTSGLRWAGRRCPQCEKSRVASAVRHDDFDKDMIFRQFESNGYTIKSRTHPFMIEKDGQVFQLGVRRAKTEGANITIESQPDLKDDIVALVFESVRIVTPEQIQGLPVFRSSSNPVMARSNIQTRDEITL